MKLSRTWKYQKVEIELTQEELFQAHQEYLFEINREYISGCIGASYQLNESQQNHLKQNTKLMEKLWTEKEIQMDKYNLEEEEAVAYACRKYETELLDVIKEIQATRKPKQGLKKR